MTEAMPRNSALPASRRTKAAGLMLCSFMLAASLPAFAGFEWRSPTAAAKPPVAPPAPSAVEWHDAAPPMPPQKIPQVEAAPIVPPAAAVTLAPPEVLSGFGADLPLVTALQQILPPQYKASFSAGVNPGTVVSWKGDRPWREVLADMLAAKKLGFRIEDNFVVITAGTAALPERLLKPATTDQRAATVKTEPGPAPIALTAPPSPPSAAPTAVTAPPPPESAAVPTLVAPLWQADKTQTLKDVLSAWSQQAGAELYWSIDYDYHLNGDIAYNGSFENAVGKLLDRFTAVRPQPYGRLHQEPGGRQVLVIASYDSPN